MSGSWFTDCVALLDEEQRPQAQCFAGHVTHERTWQRITQNHTNLDQAEYPWDIMVFDPQYRDIHGYCPGDDDISRTLALYGIWEPAETKAFFTALSQSPGAVIDFGTHVGWYSLNAARQGRPVLGIECYGEHSSMLYESARHNYLTGLIHQATHWVDHETPVLPIEGAPPIAIAKIDLEGNDGHAVRALSGLMDAGNVANLLIEISPVFNGQYPSMVKTLMERYGYSAAVVNPWRAFTIDEVDEVVALAPQVDMIFSRVPYWSES